MAALNQPLAGTNAATVTASNFTSGNSFTTLTRSGTGTTATFDNAHTIHGNATSMKTHLATVASTEYVDWKSPDISVAVANSYQRFYVYMTAYPTVNTRLTANLDGASLAASLQITTTGTIRTVNSAGSVLATTTSVIPLNAWCRIEFDVTGISGSTGTVLARMYSGANLDTSTVDTGGTLSSAGAAVTGTITDVRFGQSSSVTMTTAWDLWQSDMGWSDTANPGPISAGFTGTATLSGSGTLATAATATASGTASLSGAGTLGVAAISGPVQSVALSGSGTLAAAGLPTPTATPALSGAGTLAAVGQPSPSTPATLSGSGTLAAASTLATTGTATLTGSGTLAPAATPALVGTAALSGSGTLAAAALALGTATLTGSGSLAATATVQTAATATFTGSGTLASTATVQTASATALSGSGTLAAGGVVATATAAALSGSGSLTAATTPRPTGTAALSGAGTLAGTAVAAATQTAALSGSGTLSTAASVALSRTVALSGTGTLGAVSSQKLLIVVADMQPGAAVNPPPSVVAGLVVAVPGVEAILMPGDLANDGTTVQYGYFNTMYTSRKTIIKPVPGNHDYGANSTPVSDAANYHTYFGDTQAGYNTTTNSRYWYSFDIPVGATTWHIISLNSNYDSAGVTGLTSTQQTAQLAWLQADLDANVGNHIIAQWHHARWSDGTPGNDSNQGSFWTKLRAANADIVLNGHTHSYQRFPKWNASGSADAAGIREFVVGTGGSGLFACTTNQATINSGPGPFDQLNSTWFGYMKLSLFESSYSWQFIGQDGSTYDSGSDTTNSLAFDGTASLSGSGTLAAAAVPRPAQSATLSGSGTLSAAVTVAASSIATLSGSGTLATASGVSLAGVAALSGSGTLVAAGTPQPSATPSLSGSGTLATAGTPRAAGTAALAGTGALGTGTSASATPALSGSGTLAAAGQPTTPAAATFTGSGVLAAAAVPKPTGAPSLSGIGTLTVATTPALIAAAALAGSGTLATLGLPTFTVGATLSGSGTLVATGSGVPPPRFLTVTGPYGSTITGPTGHAIATAGPTERNLITSSGPNPRALAMAGPNPHDLTAAGPEGA